jgi:uncharacterized repeat protein (TIGR02543 family)
MTKLLPSFRLSRASSAAVAVLLLFTLCAGTAWAANWGYWDATRSYLAIDMGSGTPTTYCLYDNGAGDFQGADLGAIDQGDSFTIVNYYAKTWKNGGDVTGCDYTYQILDAGSAVKESGSINNGANPNCQDNGNGNQEWSSSAGNIAVGSTLEPGTYTLAVYGQITGGNDPAGPIDDGTATAPYTATFTVVAPVSYVARIVGGDSYATLADAIAAADPGDTVELLDDIETDATVSVAKDLTIDLGGFTLSPAAGLEKTFTASAGTVVVTNGTIAGRVNCYDSSTLTVAANTTVDGYVVVWGDGTYGEAGCLTPAFNLYGTVEAGDGTAIFNGSGDESRPSINIFEGAAVNADWGVILNGGANAAMSGGTINAGSRGIEATGGGTVTLSGGAVNATGSGIGLWEGATLAMTGGDIVAGEFGVFNNGSQTNYTTTIAVSGGSITSTNTENTACGIYQAGPGTLTLSGTAVVSGPDAVEVRAGTVEVLDNARLVATMAYTAPTSNGNGNSGHGGAALLVSQHTTVQAIDATVSGGTLEGEVAFAEVTVEADNDGSLVTGSIDGGTIAGVVTTENIETLIPSTSAALFSNADAEGVEEGYALKETSEGSGVYQVVKTYVVTYANDDGTPLQVTTNFVGEATPAYAGATPTKPADAQYTYTFKDWGTVAATVTADATYTATYSSTLNKYTVTFEDEDGTPISSAQYEYGTLAADIVKPADPTKAADAQYTYTFDAWSPAVANVIGDVTYTATYSSTVNKYTVTFEDEDGTEISSEDYDYGTLASAIVVPADPTKAADAQYTYSFAGWTPALVDVTTNATYTAMYGSTVNKYRLVITYVTPAGTVTPEGYAAEYEYGEEYNVESPDVDGCTPDIAAVTGAMGGADVAVTVTYTLNQYTVTFKDEDGSVISSADYDYGTAAADIVKPADPTKEADAQYTYSFAGWSPTLAEVTEDATYTATYSSALNQYTVTFVWHGDSLVRDYDYGTPADDVAVPRNPPSYVEDNKICTFSGWDPATIAAVTGDATYTATYTETAAIAKIGDTFYATLAGAFAAAGDGDTITLLADVALTDWIEVDKAVTLDIGTYNVTAGAWAPADAGNDALFCVLRGGSLTIDGTTGTIDCVDASEATPYVGVKLTKRGEAATGAEAALVVNGGTIRADYFAVSGNGTRHGTSVTINGGTLEATAADGVGIYNPQDGLLTIAGGTVRGATAVEIRAGTLEVTGGDLVATAAAYAATPNGGGSTTVGAALAIAQHTTGLGIDATVSGGTFTGPEALSVADPQDMGAAGVSVAVSGGTFTGAVESFVPAISGGTFSEAVPEAACAVGYIPKANGDGTYGVEPGWTVTFVNEKGDAPAAQKIADGSTASEPEEPTAEGFAFAGWFAEGGSEAFDFDTAITADLTLTAAWDTKVAVPEAVAGLVYDSTEQSGVVADTGYTLADNTAINAGGYTATATLEAGFIWADGTTGAKEIPWSIAAAPVTVTAENASKVYGDADPELTYTSSGLVGSDAFSGALSRVAGEAVGTYEIGQGTLTAGGNYSLSYTSANLTIERKALTVRAVNATKTYGASDPTLMMVVSGLANGDNAGVITCSITREAGETVGTYAITPAGNAVQGNYTVSYQSATFTITSRPLTVTADDASKTEGESDPAFSASITSGSLAAGQTIAYSYTREAGETAGTYAITPSAAIDASGTDVTANYDITVVPGSLAIEPDYIGATSADGLVVLSTNDTRCVEPLAFRSIAVDGTTVTADFSGTIVNPNGVDTTELGAFYLTTLTGTPVTNCVTATISDIDAANGTATMTVELPAGFDSATFFLAGFGDAE